MTVRYHWQDISKMESLTKEIWEVGFSAIHAKSVEYGAEPHKPPYEYIHAWVRRKLNIKDEREATEVAWAIKKKIEMYGTDAQPYFRPAIEQARNEYHDTYTMPEDVAEAIFNRAQDNIIEQGITDRGTLLKSAYYRRIR